MAGKPSLKKRVLKSGPVHFFGSFVASLIMRAIFISSRVQYQFPQSVLPYLHSEAPAIFCFWHGRMIMHPFVKPKRPMYVLISHHNDGALITMTMKWFGIDSVRTARKRGGTPAIRELLAVAHRADNISITPDGPRGPFQVAADGAAYVAQKTGYPIVPVTFSASRHWRLRSWDKFMVPKFFTRILFIAGEPIIVSTAPENEDAAIALGTAQLQEYLVRITAEADQTLGVTPA